MYKFKSLIAYNPIIIRRLEILIEINYWVWHYMFYTIIIPTPFCVICCMYIYINKIIFLKAYGPHICMHKDAIFSSITPYINVVYVYILSLLSRAFITACIHINSITVCVLLQHPSSLSISLHIIWTYIWF